MSFLERVYDALKSQVEMRGDIDRLHDDMRGLRTRVEQDSDRLFDHEKRLIRIEALIDLTRGGVSFSRPSLPPE